MSLLETIKAHKIKEVASCKDLIPVKSLMKSEYFERDTLSLKEYLIDRGKTGIICEFKRKSPAKGIINNRAKVEEVTKGYANAGASGLSVLTDFIFFGGSADDLLKARYANQIPILRKDFIIDKYQIYEAKAIGADVILLIASILDKDQATDLAKFAHELGLQVLMEFHDESELYLLNEFIDIAGINNRNLKTFEVSLEHSINMAAKIPDNFLKISESGISSPGDILQLREYGFHGFLIGENFMKSNDPAAAFADFADSLKSK